MRNIFTLFLIATIHCAYGQVTESKGTLKKENYLKKSKRQKTLYWIVGGTGLGLFALGSIMFMSEFGDGLSGSTGYNEKTFKTGETLMYVGGGLTLVTIPLRIGYKNNEKLAASLSLENGGIKHPTKDVSCSSAFFLSLNINLGR
jgi:hypothetical protein